MSPRTLGIVGATLIVLGVAGNVAVAVLGPGLSPGDRLAPFRVQAPGENHRGGPFPGDHGPGRQGGPGTNR